jgi:iron complex outermembrane receptor protein
MTKVNGISLSLVAAATFLNVANADSIDLGDVSVTATKTERKVSDVPASINILTQKDIENSVALGVNEVLKNVAGLNIRNSLGLMSASTTNKLYMRGFGGTDARSLILLDGVPLNDSLMGSVEWNQIPMSSIQRIEVVKGSGSSLYGSNAMGGVINIITKKPKEQKTDVSFSYGSMETKIGSISTTGKINKFGYFFSGEMAKSDGYITEIASKQKNNTIKKGVERENVNLKFSYDIDDSSDITASYLYYHNQSIGVLDVPSGYNPFEQTMHTLQASYAKYFDNSSDMKITIYSKPGDNSYDSLKYNATYQTELVYKDKGKTDDYGGTLQYTYSPGDHVITVGIDYKNSYADKKDTYTSGDIILTKGSQDYYGIFAQDEWFVNKQFILNIGARMDYYKSHSGEIHDEVNSVDTIHPNKHFDAFSPKIGAVYHLTNSTSLRASVGKAFRAPTVYDLYRDYISYDKTYAGNANLDPETVISYEIGIDQKIEKGNIHITAYRSDAEDFIYSIDPLNPLSTNYKEKTNVGEVEIQGIEFEADYTFTDAWKLLANYTYNESKIKKFEPNTALEGKYLTYIPKNKASVSIEYMNPNFINITASGRYEGKRYSDDMNSESSAYKSYALYDLKLSKKITKNSQFELSVNDLFDKGYVEYYNSPGRVVMATLKMSF